MILLASDSTYNSVWRHSHPQIEIIGVGSSYFVKESRNIKHAQEIMHEHKDDGILMLEGGIDISPSLYGAKRTFSYGADRVRDSHEIALVQIAIQLKMPILGICRGHQLLAAVFGGTLYQDMREELGFRHRSGHNVVLTTLGEEIWPAEDSWYVNSMHHQAVKNIPTNAELVASCEKGVCEALYYKNIVALGVQWHPEVSGDTFLLEWLDTKRVTHNTESVTSMTYTLSPYTTKAHTTEIEEL